MIDEQKGTEYVVLRAEGDEKGAEVTREVGRVRATNDVAAIKAVAASEGENFASGAYAIPARSWRRRKPQKKVQETTTWS